MYKVISNIDYGVILETRNWEEAKMIAKKYGVAVYKRNEKILDFK